MVDNPTLKRFENSYQRISDLSTRSEIVAHLEADTLESASNELLVATALDLAPADTVDLTAQAVTERVEELLNPETAIHAQARMLASIVAIAYEEYMNYVRTCASTHRAAPLREEWDSLEGFALALTAYEKKMMRLERAKDTSYKRFSEASDAYRTAILTRDGMEILRSIYAQKTNVIDAVEAAVDAATATSKRLLKQ